MQATGPALVLGGRRLPLGPRAVVAAARAEVDSMPRPLRLWFAFLATLLAIGGMAALISLPPGWEVFGTSPSFEWGLLIVGYVCFAITTSGLCLASSLGTVFGIDRFRPLEKRHAILAVLCLTTAFGIIALDLHWPIRMVFGAMLVPSPSSPMWWMGVFYGGYLVFLLVEIWSMFFHHPRIHNYACLASSFMAILAPATLGAVFGVLGSKPFWAGPFTPILMVASALLAGTCLLGIVFYAVHRLGLAGAERATTLAIPGIRLVLGVALTLVALLVAREIVVGLAGGTPGLREATDVLVSGPLALPFWILRVGGGLAVPLLLVLIPATRTPRGLLVASVLALIGVFVDRLTFVAAGQAVPISTMAGTVSTPYSSYLPSPVEMAVIVGAFAFVAFGYTLAERYLDLNESEGHVGFAWPWIRSAVLIPADGPAMVLETAPVVVTETAVEPTEQTAVEPTEEPVEAPVEPVEAGESDEADAGTDEAPAETPAPAGAVDDVEIAEAAEAVEPPAAEPDLPAVIEPEASVHVEPERDEVALPEPPEARP